MNRRIRRALLILALGVFILVTPVIVLYALGFRPTSSRVGVLLLESVPSSATVLVNGIRRGEIPYTISGRGGSLLDITIEKPGYRPWQKKLSLVTGATVEARGVRLIPEIVLPQEFVLNASAFTLSPSRALVATVEGRTLTVRDIESEIVLPPVTFPASPDSLLWSPDSTLILVKYGKRLDLVSLTEGTRQSLPITVASSDAATAWDPRTPGRLLFLSPTGILAAYDTRSATQQTLAQQVSAFAPSQREIIIVTTDFQLKRITLVGGALSGRDFPLGKPVERLSVSPEGHIALMFTDHVLAVIVEGKLLNLASSIESFGFSPSGRMVYVQTAPNELRVFNIDEERLQHVPPRRLHLVTRLSEPITHPQWFAGGQHLIYQLGDQIVLTEIDTRDHVISHVLDSTNLPDAAVAVGEEGESLLYLKRTPTDTISLSRTPLLVE